ncbi:MAG: ACP S-malonyltransferase [Rickettsiaceae bacterium]|nr:ACP S-malonyltransferase [Rickettsiaceae bacterium]
MNRAFIFPGQGSQAISMGKDFYDSQQEAKRVYQEVDDTLGFKLSDIIFNGPEGELALTTNTQPALMATSIAILRVMQQKSGKKINELCQVVAGHSLGEYSALCAANAISLEDTTRLLQVRSSAMQEASPKGVGAMAACIGISTDKLETMLGSLIDEGVCQIANDNVEGQIVISGHEYNVDRVVAALKDTGHRAIKLNVSAPFHSSLIKEAEGPMQLALDKVEFSQLDTPLVANVSADIVTDIAQVKANLVQQICGTVRWRETMDKLASMGVYELVEIGSGRVLAGLAKKSPHNFTLTNIATTKDLEGFLDSL